MKYSFNCYGHPNITALHKNTLEFTKDDFVTKKGDCIVGCRADFDLSELKKFIQTCKSSQKIKMMVQVHDSIEEICGFLNASFDDDKELVIRKSDFDSRRTLMHKANKTASELDRKMILRLKDPSQKVSVTLQA